MLVEFGVRSTGDSVKFIGIIPSKAEFIEQRDERVRTLWSKINDQLVNGTVSDADMNELRTLEEQTTYSRQLRVGPLEIRIPDGAVSPFGLW